MKLRNCQNKEELRNEKLMQIEKTYSLSPHKTKHSKSPKIIENANLDRVINAHYC